MIKNKKAMFLYKHLVYFLWLCSVIASPQVNLHLAGSNEQQQNCLYYDASEESSFREIIPFCMSELSSKFQVEDNNGSPMFTFAELNQKNVTSEQLYRWSAPVDTCEQYQLYLELLDTGRVLPGMETQLFYNCSSFEFGPQCQYRLNAYTDDFSLNRMIHISYNTLSPLPKSLTCYTHLQCDLGLTSRCLDWSEICDGKIDCLDGIDEKNCEVLLTNQCKDDEYRCDNGQCISSTFVKDSIESYECLDRSDEPNSLLLLNPFGNNEPRFVNEDIVCSWRKNHTEDGSKISPLSSSCNHQRHKTIKQAILSTELDSTITNDCFVAIKCHSKISIDDNELCLNSCQNKTCIELIRNVCPSMLFYPTVPIAFSHIYFAYTNQYLINETDPEGIPPEYICYNEQLCAVFPSDTSTVSFKGATCRRSKDLLSSIPSVRRD